MKTCDNTSVGIVITDHQSRYLMFDRATFPPGTAPAAGHIDDHGTAEDAARAEVEEELGLTVTGLTTSPAAGGTTPAAASPAHAARATTGPSTRPPSPATSPRAPARRRTSAGSLPTL
jgi:hypothetical protein